MESNRVSTNPLGDCFVLVNDSVVHYLFLNIPEERVLVKQLSPNCPDARSILVDPFGNYVLLIGSNNVSVFFLYRKSDGYACIFSHSPLSVLFVRFSRLIYSNIELPSKIGQIASVVCHPRISGIFVILQKDGTIGVYDMSQGIHPVYSTGIKIPSLSLASPLTCSFGSDCGTDQFSLYVSYSTGHIVLVKMLPLPNYFLSSDDVDRMSEQDPSMRPWLQSWKTVDDYRISVLSDVVISMIDPSVIHAPKENSFHSALLAICRGAEV